jgi:FKBP-type peptidyl-prolyl cis-trans isomerase SlyD
MKVAANTVVKLTYELRNEENGPVVDSATKDRPFLFLVGHNNVLDKFEKNLDGMVPGGTFKFMLTPEEGYGQYDEDGVIQLERNVFAVDGVVQDDVLFVGNIVELQDQHHNPFKCRIVDISADKITVDFNHPLAGKNLFFSGEILEVDKATALEVKLGRIQTSRFAEQLCRQPLKMKDGGMEPL